MIDCKNCSSYDNCTNTKCPIYDMWMNRKNPVCGYCDKLITQCIHFACVEQYDGPMEAIENNF